MYIYILYVYILCHILFFIFIPLSQSAKKSSYGTLRITSNWRLYLSMFQDWCRTSWWQIVRVNQIGVLLTRLRLFLFQKDVIVVLGHIGTIWPSYIHWCSEAVSWREVRCFIRQCTHIFSSVKLSRFESLQIQILPKPKAARSRSHLLQQVHVIVCLLGAASKEH